MTTRTSLSEKEKKTYDPIVVVDDAEFDACDNAALTPKIDAAVGMGLIEVRRIVLPTNGWPK